jgi:hypothetical protein
VLVRDDATRTDSCLDATVQRGSDGSDLAAKRVPNQANAVRVDPLHGGEHCNRYQDIMHMLRHEATPV